MMTHMTGKAPADQPRVTADCASPAFDVCAGYLRAAA